MNDFDDDQFSDGLTDPFDNDNDNDFGDDLDEIIVDDEYTDNSRSFPLYVLGLLGVGVASLICLGLYLFIVDQPNPEEEAQAIANQGIAETSTIIAVTNEFITTQNAFVTQTLEARELTANAPTETSTPAPSDTPTQTRTPVPTTTPAPAENIVGSVGGSDDDGEGSEEAAGGEGDASEEVASVGDEAIADADSSGTGDASSEAAIGGSGDTSSSTGNAVADTQAELPDTLPETGFSIAGAIAAALGLAALFFLSRRLRTQM
ncbi:MAG: hypothetical protein AAF633_18950 [Chloroflexota bacterium]